MTSRLHQLRHVRARHPLRAILETAGICPLLLRAGGCTTRLAALFFGMATLIVQAQPASSDDFFNGGAQFYISNNIPAALERTESGLKLYPNDAKLKKLETLLKQQQQQQQQNQQSQQSQSQQQQQQNQQNQQQQNSQNQQNRAQQNQQQQNQQNQQQQNQQAQQPQQQNTSGGSTNQQQQATAAQGKEMTPEEAKQLLDAQKDNEQVLQFQPQGKPENQNRQVKDW